MSFEGQVLCQRMLIGPWARTMAGAATVAAAPAAATFRKRRRVEALSWVVMVSSPLDSRIFNGPALIYWPQHKGLRGGLARMIAEMRRFDAACIGKPFRARRGLFPSRGEFFASSLHLSPQGRGEV